MRLSATHLDPIQRVRRQSNVITLIGVVILVFFGMWTFWPKAGRGLPLLDLDLRAPAPNADSVESDDSPLNQELFASARLWHPLLPAQGLQSTVDKTPTVTRPHLQLIGIIDEGPQRFAALYHTETDKLLIVTSGDRIEPYLVESVSRDGVELVDGRHTTRLLVKRQEDRP